MQIQSFFLQSYLKMLSSNTFYPSNCNERILTSRGSIQGTICDHSVDIFVRQENPVTSSWKGKTVRFLLRLSYTNAIGFIAAPLGVVYHGALIGKYTFLWFRERGDGHQIWQRIEAHSTAFFADLWVAGLTYLGVSSIATPIIFDLGMKQLATGCFVSIWSVILSAKPQLCSIAALQAERVPIEKSIVLKNQFGIVCREGLLPFDIDVDDEIYQPEDGSVRGHFASLLQSRTKRYRLKMIQINNLLGTCKIPEPLDPSLDAFMKHLTDNRELILQQDSLTAANLDKMVEKMNRLFKEAREMRACLQNAFKSKEFSLLNTFFKKESKIELQEV